MKIKEIEEKIKQFRKINLEYYKEFKNCIIGLLVNNDNYIKFTNNYPSAISDGFTEDVCDVYIQSIKLLENGSIIVEIQPCYFEGYDECNLEELIKCDLDDLIEIMISETKI